MTKKSRTREATLNDARTRLLAAQAYLEVAELALGEDEESARQGVAAGVAVLAGIAASDALCARRLGLIHRGDDHRAAGDLLAQATAQGRNLKLTFAKLIGIKDEAHYGLTLVSRRKARDAVRWATILVETARRELER